MAFHSLTTMFVVPPSNTLPTTGSTEDLVAKQFGIFLSDYSVATSANSAAAKYLYLAQGRLENYTVQGSKRSDKIEKSRIKRYYKIVAEPNVPSESITISNFHVQCGEDVTISVVSHSNYIDVGFFNGRTQSVTVTAPCCACGTDPCTDIAAIDTQALVDAIVTKLGQSQFFSRYFTFFRSGSGATSALVLTGQPLAADGTICSDISVNPYMYDRLWYRAFAYSGPATTADFLVYDKCNQVATVTITSRALYPTGSSDQILLLEKEFYSYQSAAFKELYRNSGWNGAYESYVVSGTFYDFYYLEFRPFGEEYEWTDQVEQDAAVILAIPAGQGTAIEAILSPYLGAVENKSAAAQTTSTSTTSTSSTSTSTTTILQP